MAVRLQPHLFKIVLTVIGLVSHEALREDAKGTLDSLSKAAGVSTADLFKRETGVQLSQLKKECETWSHNSHRLSVFEALMTEAGAAVGYYPDLVVEVIQIVLARCLLFTPNSVMVIFVYNSFK